MYERLIYTNSIGESIEFSPYSVYHTNVTRDVTGLAEFNAQHVTVQNIDQDGETWLAGRVKSKQITVKGAIRYPSRAQASVCRQQLNHILNPKLSGTLTYVRDDFRRAIECHPSALPFSHSKLLDEYSFTLDCPDPYWRQEARESNALSSWSKLWVWRNINGRKATYIEQGVFYFGRRQQDGYVDSVNIGDADAGALFVFVANDDVSNPCITNLSTGEIIRVVTEMVVGDEITVDTRTGHKTVTLTRQHVTTDIFGQLDPASTFFPLRVGSNLLQLSADSGVEDLDAYARYYPSYLGV